MSLENENDIAISLDVLRHLDGVYPEKCPEITWSDRKVWEETGKRKVVRHLIAIYNVQHPEAPYTQHKVK